MPPVKLCLELSGSCNLRCNMCPSSKKDVSKFLMSYKILNRIPRENLEWVNLFGYGEGFLNPKWRQFAKYFYKHGITTFIETNGMSMDFSLNHVKLPYVTQIGFSIDGFHSETNDRYRKGASLEYIKKNIKALRSKRPDLYIRIVFCARVSNIEEFTLMPLLCKEVGANELKFLHMIAYNKAQQDEVLYYHKEKTDVVLTITQEVCDALSIKLSAPAGRYKDYRGKSKCFRPEKQMFVKYDGDVRVCMLHDEVLGNLYSQSLQSIWESGRYHELRSTVNTDKAVGNCVNCQEYDSMDIMDESSYLQYKRK